jgi:hypothetical protein
VFENFRDSFPQYPLINHFILLQDVKVDAGMFCMYPVNLRARPPALPRLHPLWWHVDAQRTLGFDLHFLWPIGTFSHFHDQRKLLPRTVKLGIKELLKRMGVYGYVFSHPAVLYHKIEAFSIYLLGRYPVNGTCPYQSNLMFVKPLPFIPVIDLKMFQVRFCKTREIQIAAVAAFHVGIYHTQHIN